MQRVRNILMSVIAAATLAACGGGGGGGDVPPPTGGSANPIEALEAAGKLPKLDRTESAKGVDANNNGVRDDIEAIIVAKYPQPAQKAAVMQFARSYQLTLEVPAGNRQAAKNVSIKTGRAHNCMSQKFDQSTLDMSPGYVGKQIVAMTFNTKPRMNAYVAYNESLSGSVLSLPSGDTCDE